MTLAQIGRYAIKGELGRGGMATVYRAYDPRFKRHVAVKILPREFLHEPEFRQRFEREAETIAALEHAAIVPVYDYGEEDGQPYLVMRLMTGGSLADRLARGPLTPQETAHILARLAPALDRAHALGIVHRDLKPGNILFDADGNPYVSDFGLAKLTQSNTQLSRTGIMGTPAYMSPEQARGEKQIDGRSDVYALGVIVYHALTSKLPYEADTPIGLAFKHITEPPPSLRAARPDLPAGLDAVISRAMAKQPDQRFASAAGLRAAFEAALSPVTERPVPAPDPPTLITPALDSTFATPDGPATAARTDSAPSPPPQPAARPPWPLIVGGLALMGLAGVVVVGLAVMAILRPLGGGTPTPRVQSSPVPSVPVIAAASSTAAPQPTLAPTVTADLSTATSPPPSPTLPAPTPQPGATRRSSVDNMVQVYVPPGEFAMGNDLGPPDQRPMHTVFLDSFWIDRTEVTNAMFALCVASGVCPPPLETRSFTRASYYGNDAFADHPVLFVNWHQAKTYCEWAGRRLPTEAEWEKAARGADMRLYPWGGESPAPDRLNYGPSGLGDTVAVGQYPEGASPYGALDMAGNAWEWVADWYDPDYYAASPLENPAGPEQTGCPEGDCKVLRGGSWDSQDDQVMTTARLFYGPSDSRDAFTIRCAQTAD